MTIKVLIYIKFLYKLETKTALIVFLNIFTQVSFFYLQYEKEGT